ncbi:Alcohol dehydrogenase [acceptor] protein-like protein [Colletotrichum chlorophyti]|uniref:Alcohol dehydrogenase [acceptor] protein-like protein n=1 Tax=Colletotrichum chlorophyti TaxID=708187 RepID=A0A1Q8RG90_9PEZI|nr:Alcohol dehydrogenase [acceptor] protein-like protein [Colletotrichum chlorophyti]
MPLWDFIVVGGGLAGSVISNRLLHKNPSLKILLVEAGPNVNGLDAIAYPNTSTGAGSDLDWAYSSIPQVHLDNRSVASPAGKALGGGTAINGAAWVRGHTVDYDLWAEVVGDSRWSYDGLLPYMKLTEKFFDASINPSQHGNNGSMIIQGVKPMSRQFPMREKLAESFEILGVSALPGLDANAGNPIGYGDLQENRHEGRRQLSSEAFPLDGVTVLTNTMVEKVLLEKSPNGSSLTAKGVRLENGTEYRSRKVILSAGAYRTPQLLLLSGVGPADVLTEHGIEIKLDQPEVGQNMHDHILMPTAWKVKNPSEGWAYESNNPLFQEPQYGLGNKIDFIATTTLPKEGLAAAIAEDEGVEPGPDHPLLRDRAHVSHSLQYNGASADGSAVLMLSIVLIDTSRGSVGISSANISDPPVINPNYLGTAVDRYAVQEALKFDTKLLGSDITPVGREILAGEFAADAPLTVNSSDEAFAARARQVAGSCFHPSGTAAMGKVVNTDLSVKGVNGLFVADSSIFPVSISANLQVAMYAMALQAADIIGEHKNKCYMA